jgi:hypothetical protein
VIIEFLQPDPGLLDGATVLLGAVLYATSLGAGRLGLLLAFIGHHIEEAQRVAIAPAFASRTSIILAGEPTAALDAERARDHGAAAPNCAGAGRGRPGRHA